MKQQDSIDTILFSIGQTCDMCNVTPRTLRYYEKIGLIRRYSELYRIIDYFVRTSSYRIFR